MQTLLISALKPLIANLGTSCVCSTAPPTPEADLGTSPSDPPPSHLLPLPLPILDTIQLQAATRRRRGAPAPHSPDLLRITLLLFSRC